MAGATMTESPVDLGSVCLSLFHALSGRSSPVRDDVDALLKALATDEAFRRQVAFASYVRAKAAAGRASLTVFQEPEGVKKLLQEFGEGKTLYGGGVVTQSQLCAEFVTCCELASTFGAMARDGETRTNAMLATFAADPLQQ